MISKTRLLWAGLLLAFLSFGSASAALPAEVAGKPVTSLAPLVEAASPNLFGHTITLIMRNIVIPT